ncbi:HlyC/CorC family transporter [Endozoicomonadaceae bacterium StTr2]
MNEDHSSAKSGWLDKLSHFFSNDPKDKNELLDSMREAASRNVLEAEALDIIEGAIQVADMQVREIMVPRSKMVCVDVDQQPEDFLPKVIESAHSRFPVIGDNKDEVQGILLAKDLLPLMLTQSRNPVSSKSALKFNIKDHLRPATFVPESKRLNVLLNDFRRNRNHMAIVIDEYGGVAGLVTIEDVLEQIVGDIEDEHDLEEESWIKPLDEHEFVVKALTPIEDFNEHFQSDFSDEEFDTIGGIVMQRFGHLPKRSESVSIGKLRFQVLNADNRRIRLLKVSSHTA